MMQLPRYHEDWGPEDSGVIVAERSDYMDMVQWPCEGCGEHRVFTGFDLAEAGPKPFCPRCLDRNAAETRAELGLLS